VALLRAAGRRLTALRLEAVDAAGDGACAAIAGAVVPFKALSSLALCSLPSVTDAGIDAIAEALQGAWAGGGGGGGAPPRALAALQLSSLPRVCRPDVVLALILGAAGGFGAPAGGGDSGAPSARAAAGGLASVRLTSLPALSDAALVALARTSGRSLQRLDVSMSRGTSDAGVGALCDACPRLRRLVVWGCSNLTGEFHLGHARAGWAGREGEPAPARSRAHPDLPWAPLQVVGRAGDATPEPTVEDWEDPLGEAWPGEAA
jgi:DNA repair protein RAD7